MARALALAAAIAVSLLAVSGAGGASAQTPKRGGTLLFGSSSREPACLNVLLARCVPPQITRYIVDLILEQPFEVGPDFEFRPRLVSSVAFTRTPPFTLTYHIRPEARWSDGTQVTARDFAFTLHAIRSSGTPEERMLHSVIRRVHAVDAKTVRVTLQSRVAAWRSLFRNILPRHALAGEDLEAIWSDRIDNPKTGRPIGNGPFLLERWERGRELTLRRNPNYWGTHLSYVDRLVVRFWTGTDQSEALRKGELDITQGMFPASIPALRREPGLRVAATPGAAFEHFDLRIGPGGHSALKNKLVRRALAFGIDRAALVRKLWGEIAPQSRPFDSAVLLSQSGYYEPNWNGYSYRPAEARRLLEQAGCRRGADSIHVCGGERMSLRFVTPAGNPTREQELALVQAQLRAVGVEVVPTFAPNPVVIGRILPSGDFDVALFSWVYPEPVVEIKSIFGCGGADNYTGYCQRLVTRELDQANRILDERQRARVLNGADRQLARDVPLIPLFQYVTSAARHASVRNVRLHPLDQLWNAEDWWLAR